MHRDHAGSRTASAAAAVEDVDVPFRLSIPSGHSRFTLAVPRHYIQSEPPRRFHFNHLEVMPDFFTLEAEKLDLDADFKPDEEVHKDLVIRIHYNDPRTTYGASFEHNTTSWKTLKFLKHLNKHFESEKPSFANTSAFFVDWTDLVTEKKNPPGTYVPVMSNLFYGEKYDEGKHGNFLPLSVHAVENANIYMPPLDGKMTPEDLFVDRVRLRLWMAPFTVAVFSNVNLFTKGLGFRQEDLGDFVNRQYRLANDTHKWKTVVAAEAPKKELAVGPFRLTLRAADTDYSSRLRYDPLPQKDWLQNAKLAAALGQAFKETSQHFNLAVSLNYDATNKTFSVDFPESEEGKVAVVSFSCDPMLAHRLGFGYSAVITPGMTAKPQKERHSVKDAHLSALAVVFDTGPIICQLDQVSSNTTSGLIDRTVASLYPHRAGTLKMPPVRCACALQSPQNSQSFSVRVNTHSTDAFFPVGFVLKRIYDDGSCSDFKWTNDAYVYGVLRGSSSPSPSPLPLPLP